MPSSELSTRVLNVPNIVTASRLILSIAVFVLIAVQLYLAAIVVFIVAAGTDWVDGYWARRFHQVTKVGRIFDPFVDKVIICGTFIFLAAEPHTDIVAWMAVVVVCREMLVTALRSFIEQQGGDFSASWAGKWKMVFQCVAVVLCLWALEAGPRESRSEWLLYASPAAAWLAVLSTVYSGAGYVRAAARYFRN